MTTKQLACVSYVYFALVMMIMFLFPDAIKAQETVINLSVVEATGGFDDVPVAVTEVGNRRVLYTSYAQTERLILNGFKFNSSYKESHHTSLVGFSDTTEDVSLLDNEMLVYPNPFNQQLKSFSDLPGATFGGQYVALLYYRLSQAADVELQIYNMLGRLIHKSTKRAGSDGGQEDRNYVPLDELLGNRKLSTGVYFAYLVHEDRIIGKTKFGVKP